MGDNNKHRKFLTYINKIISKEGITIIYDANNIKYDKCELYNDYIQSLLLLVFNTYLGDEITNDDNKIKHFNWCWYKNIENFREEGIFFDDKKLYEYFLEYLFEVFYRSDEKEIETVHKYSIKLWSDIFNYNKPKTQSDIDTFLEIYKIFDKSMNFSEK